MFFLNERLIAAFLSIIAFFVSFAASLYYQVAIRAALFRSLICAFIFMLLGSLFGKIIKNLVVESFTAKRKEEETTGGGRVSVNPEETKPEVKETP